MNKILLVTALTFTIASPSIAQSAPGSPFFTRAEVATLNQSGVTSDEEDPTNKCTKAHLNEACLILEACYRGGRDNDNIPGSHARDVVSECAKRVGCLMRKFYGDCELKFQVYKRENEDKTFKDLWCNNRDITGIGVRSPFNDGEVEVPTAQQCLEG